MKTVLFVDFLCNKGHIFFNNIYIKALTYQNNFKVDLAFSESYYSEIDCYGVNRCFKIPNTLYKSTRGVLYRLTNRLQILKTQNYIKKHIDLDSYDLVLVSSFDILTILLTNLPRQSVLICHQICDFTRSSIKLKAVQRVAKLYKLCVLNDESKDFLKSKGINNVFSIPHGIREPFKPHMGTIKYSNDANEYIMFLASCSNIDFNLIQQITISSQFNSLLIAKNIRLIIKSPKLHSSQSNVEIITKYLSKEEYQNLFIRADYIFLPYKTNFKYQETSVFFEAITNNKQIIIRDIDRFNSLKNVKTGIVFFSTFEDLIRKIKELNVQRQMVDYTIIKQSYSPEVINSIISSLI